MRALATLLLPILLASGCTSGIQDCGSVPETDLAARDCFDRAFATCSPASMIFITDEGLNQNYNEIRGYDEDTSLCTVFTKVLTSPNESLVDKSSTCKWDNSIGLEIVALYTPEFCEGDLITG